MVARSSVPNEEQRSTAVEVSASLVVSDILGDRAKGCHRSTRNADKADEEAVWLVAERIAAEVDALAGSAVHMEPSDAPAAGAACCACSSPSQEGKLEIKGKPVAIAGLPLIFQQLQKKGLKPDAGLRRHVAENGQDLSLHRRPRGSGLSRCTCGGIPRVLRAVVRHGPCLEPTMERRTPDGK